MEEVLNRSCVTRHEGRNAAHPRIFDTAKFTGSSLYLPWQIVKVSRTERVWNINIDIEEIEPG